MRWSLVFTKRAQRDLKGLDQQVAERILEALERFAESGHGDVRRVVNVEPPEWRLRVGDWRVFLTFQRDDGVVVVLRIRHRGAAYR